MKRTSDLIPGDEPRSEAAVDGGPRVRGAQWRKGVVLLCSKCSGEQHEAAGPETMPSMGTWELRCWLKTRLTEDGLWPRVRVLTSSCMGICNDGSITCAFGGDLGGQGAECLVLDPARDREQLLEWIRASVEGPAPV